MIKTMIALMVLIGSFAWGQSSTTSEASPAFEECNKTAQVATKLLDDLRKTPDVHKKAEMIHSQGSDKIERLLATCRVDAMNHADITFVNYYADLQTWLMAEDYDTLRGLTKKLQAECH